MAAKTAKVLRIPDADEMDDELFIQHFEKRHSDQMGGLTEFLTDDSLTIEMYRDFHDALHRWHIPAMLANPHRHLEG